MKRLAIAGLCALLAGPCRAQDTKVGTVVAVGTTDWAHGLRGHDSVVKRLTRNVLDRVSGTKAGTEKP